LARGSAKAAVTAGPTVTGIAVHGGTATGAAGPAVTAGPGSAARASPT
jgi:hypothetical protein